MERIVEMLPAWDKRDADSSKNYGIHGVELRMVLKGEEGAVQFVLYTNWHLPHVTDSLLQGLGENVQYLPGFKLKVRGNLTDEQVDSITNQTFKQLQNTARVNLHALRMDVKTRFSPMPADLGYHSPIPHYEGQIVVDEHCKYLDGRPCYYDGSGLNALRVYNILLEKGSEGVWKELEEYYENTFK
jgi:hypothetical protein